MRISFAPFVVALLIFLNVASNMFGDTKFKYQLAICAIFRDEAPYLKEWIEYHRLIGVEHFYLYNNRSTDNFEEVLAPYVASGVVDLFHNDIKTENLKDHIDKVQCKSYSHALELSKGQVKWLAIMDADEFIFPIKEKSL